ncbi:MAG: hypothetical protein EOO39_07270 [Cytophagaceae bacterium]|nr:MAG: hypothetical protein EOO39_07270 [Cytophagaceae bacterium]
MPTSANIAFYVHHHGSGHLMRCLTISKLLLAEYQITFLGSGLSAYASILPPAIHCIELPLDTPSPTDVFYSRGNSVEGLHYAPLNVQGQRQRTALLTDFFLRESPLVLVVDVSVEVTLLARLCGVPTVVIKQHGYRNDLAHRLAYQSAQLVLAPYSIALQQHESSWLARKLVYTGGFCRYLPQANSHPGEQANHVAVLIGTGGSSLDRTFVTHLAQQLPNWIVEVVGTLTGGEAAQPLFNLVLHGHQDDPRWVIDQCRVIIGNAGHNTVMEMAALQKRFIVVPEPRPFEEQVVKATLLSDLALAHVIDPKDLYQISWSTLLTSVSEDFPRWHGLVDEQASSRAAQMIRDTCTSLSARGSTSL